MKPQFRPFAAIWLLLAAALIALPPHATGAEKLFDFGDLDVDLSKVETRETPSESLPSSDESPAPAVLSRDDEISIDDVIRGERVTVTPVEVRSESRRTLKIDYPVVEDRPVIEVKIAAGSEKKGWMEKAAAAFMADPVLNQIEGRPIRLIIDKIGSIKSGNLIRSGQSVHRGRNEYQVWAPASSAFRTIVEQAFSGGKLFESDDSIARSPMVFVTWHPVQEAIDRTLEKSMSFDTVTELFSRELRGEVVDPHGREYQFGFTQPWSSNSGAVALITMAYEYFAKERRRYRIRMRDLEHPGFQAYLAFMKYMSDQTKSSTGKLSEPLMQAGYGGQPLSTIYVYENLAVKLAYIRKINAPDGAVPIIRYPRYNLISDHPYYTLRHANSKAQVEAALRFRDFLLSREQQLMALQTEGFRPVSTEISNQEMNEVLGSFVASNGLIPDLIKASQILVPAQDGEVLAALIEMYRALDFPEGDRL